MEEEEQEEEVVVEEEEEEKVVVEEEEEEEVVVEEEEQEEVVVQEEEEEEVEYIPVIINKKKYYTADKENGEIYEFGFDGDLGDEIGKYKNGKPFFHKK